MRPCRRTADEPYELAPLHAFPQRTRLVQGIITTTSRPAVVREMAPSRSPNGVGLMSQLGQTRKYRRTHRMSLVTSNADMLTGLRPLRPTPSCRAWRAPTLANYPAGYPKLAAS